MTHFDTQVKREIAKLLRKVNRLQRKIDRSHQQLTASHQAPPQFPHTIATLRTRR